MERDEDAWPNSTEGCFSPMGATGDLQGGMLLVWLVPRPGSCLSLLCLQVLWVLEGSALPILELSNSQSPCWHSHCNKGTEWGGLCREGRRPGSLRRLDQAWQSLGFLPMSGVANAFLCSGVFTRLINPS